MRLLMSNVVAMTKMMTVVSVILLALLMDSGRVMADESIVPDQDAGPEREPYWNLFLDDHVIARSTGFRRIVRHPKPRGVVLKADKPWEGLGANPLYVGQRQAGGYEMYYRAHWPLKRGNQPPRFDHPPYTSKIAYAISDDGVHWEKPHLGFMDAPAEVDRDFWPPYPMAQGKTEDNNLVPCGHPRDMWAHGNVRDPAKRFTMSQNYGQPSDVSWGSEMSDPVTDRNWLNKFKRSGGYKVSYYTTIEYWDDLNNEWVALRQAPNHPPTRVGGRYASPDLQNWTLQDFLYPDAHDSTDPRYFDEVYGMLGVHMEGIVFAFAYWFIGDETHPSTEDRGRIGTNTGRGTMEVRVVTSRDGGRTWDRTSSREAWIPHGTEEDSYDRQVRLDCTPLRVGDEDWFYAGVSNEDHLGFRRNYRDRVGYSEGALYTQKHNRYVSLTAGNRPQILITKPLEVTGKTLQLNVDAGRGVVQVGIGIDKPIEHPNGGWPFKALLPHYMVEDRWGNSHLVEGFGLDDCQPVNVDSIEHDVEFREAKLESLMGQTVRLYLMVHDADLYGFRFK